MADRSDPYRNFRFRVELDGIETAAFSEATVPDSPTGEEDYGDAAEPPYQRKLSGFTDYANITLKKGITNNMDLYDWRQNVEQAGAKGASKDISLILVDEEGNDTCRWNIVEAWPIKYDPSDFRAKIDEVFIDTLEIVHEGIKRVR